VEGSRRSQTRWLNHGGSSWHFFEMKAFGDFSHRPEKAPEPRQTLRQEAVHGCAEIATTEKTRTQIRFGPLASIDTLQPLFIYMSEGALEQHPIEAHPALYNRIGFRDGGFGIARTCARSTNRRLLAPLRGRHLARPTAIVGTRTRRIFGQGPGSDRCPCRWLSRSQQAERTHRGHGPACKSHQGGQFRERGSDAALHRRAEIAYLSADAPHAAM